MSYGGVATDPAAPAVSTPGGGGGGGGGGKRAQQVEHSLEDNENLLQAMHWLNILNAVAIAAAAVLVFATVFTTNVAQAFIAGCLLMFGLVLLVFELRLTQYEDAVRGECGFMFTLLGRGAFLVFIGFLNLGVKGFAPGRYVGYFTLGNALFNMWALAKNPSWRTELLSEEQLAADGAYGGGGGMAGAVADAEAAADADGGDGGDGGSVTLSMMHWLNILNAVLIGAAASLGMPYILAHGGGLSEGFVAAYLVFFGCMLLAFELRTTQYEAGLRLHYGFLFTYSGRALFLSFVAALNFGIPAFAFGQKVGCFTAANLLFNMFVLHANPTYRTPAMRGGGGGGGGGGEYGQVADGGGGGGGGGGSSAGGYQTAGGAADMADEDGVEGV